MNFNHLEDNKYNMDNFPILPVRETPLWNMSPEEVFQAIRMGDIVLNDFCLNDAGQLELLFTRLMQLFNRTREQTDQIVSFLSQIRELASITYPHPMEHVATDENAEFDNEGLCVFPLSDSRIRRFNSSPSSRIRRFNSTSSTQGADSNSKENHDETPPPSDANSNSGEERRPIKREKEEKAEDSDGNTSSCSCGSGYSKCCRKCCEVEEHWLVSDSSDEIESEYSCYNDKPGDNQNPEGENPEIVTVEQVPVPETVELEDGDDDEIKIVMDFIDLTYQNNNPQIQFHQAPTPTPPPQCPCRSPPGPLATSTPNKKTKLE